MGVKKTFSKDEFGNERVNFDITVHLREFELHERFIEMMLDM